MLYLLADAMKVATRLDGPHVDKLRPYKVRRRWSRARWFGGRR